MHHYDPTTNILTLHTTQQNLNNDIDYVEWVSTISSLVENYQPRFILSIIDAPVVNYDEQMREWLELCVLPLFNRNKVEKLAFVFKQSGEDYHTPQFQSKVEFEFSFFSDRREAEAWFAS